MDAPAVTLAGRAAELSTSLYGLGERCAHEETSSDISNIAGELTLLSTTLWRLHEAIAANSDAYTAAFNDDLSEITSELTLLFDEIDECCTAMQKSDTPATTAVGWFFKRGRVQKLQKHLEALKTTLVVMRTVLHHGKDYGIQKYVPITAYFNTHKAANIANSCLLSSPGRLAESNPHTMVEDRAILESVFAQNRNAIMDLHDLEKLKGHNHSSISSTPAADETPTTADAVERSYNPGAHGRNLSNATGVEVPPIPDVLPTKSVKRAQPTGDTLSRRFSKRGVRLGVHMSILDLGAHDAASSLRRKWIAQAHTQARNGDHERTIMSTIDEDPSQPKAKASGTDPSDEDGVSASREIKTPTRTNTAESKESKARTRANSLMTSPMGKAVSKVIRRLSLTSIRSGNRGRETQGANTSSEHSEESGGGTGSGDSSSMVGGMKKKLSAHLTHPELRTPDYNQEFENGRW